MPPTPRELDHIAHVVLVFDEDEDAVEAVLDDGLRGEAEGDASDAGAGQQRCQLEAQHRQDFQGGKEYDDSNAGGPGDGRQGTHLGYISAGPALGQADHAPGDELEDAGEHPCPDEDDDNLGQGSADELLQIGEPLLVHLREELARAEPEQRIQLFFARGKHPFL